MEYKDLTEEEMDKYESALVAIEDKIRIIRSLGLEKQLLKDLNQDIPLELNILIATAVRMNIGREQLRNFYW
jgi:hypothetical protein